MLFLFFFNDTATTEIYTYLHTLSLHDALPIYFHKSFNFGVVAAASLTRPRAGNNACSSSSKSEPSGNNGNTPCTRYGRKLSASASGDRKSTRLNSSH